MICDSKMHKSFMRFVVARSLLGEHGSGPHGMECRGSGQRATDSHSIWLLLTRSLCNITKSSYCRTYNLQMMKNNMKSINNSIKITTRPINIALFSARAVGAPKLDGLVGPKPRATAEMETAIFFRAAILIALGSICKTPSVAANLGTHVFFAITLCDCLCAAVADVLAKLFTNLRYTGFFSVFFSLSPAARHFFAPRLNTGINGHWLYKRQR